MKDAEQKYNTETLPRHIGSENQPRAHNAPIAYDEALCRMKSVARQHNARMSAFTTGSIGRRSEGREYFDQSYEGPEQIESGNIILPLVAAVGEKCAREITAPYSTPTHDTSAMDGFAVSSELTEAASKAEPVRLRISHVLAAGDRIDTVIEKQSRLMAFCGTYGECVEIMTGARFPELSHPDLDAVVKIEDVVVKNCNIDCDCHFQYIEVSAPVKKHQNRRFAASDLIAGAPIIAAGERVTPNHVMALASVGYRDVTVISPLQQNQEQQHLSATLLKRVKVGVLSTGCELTDARCDPTNIQLHTTDKTKQVIPNSNGPYIVARLRQMETSVDVQYLGIAQDSEEELETKLLDGCHQRQLDVIIATGGVSMGKFDLVRLVMEQRMHARVIFHGVKVRPGLPILFALLEYKACAPSAKMTAFFGLPGNPIATAMALRFFVIPYLATIGQVNIDGLKFPASVSLHQQKNEHGHNSFHEQGNLLSGSSELHRTKPAHLNVFWLSRRHRQHDMPLDKNEGVEILEDQASYKIGTLLRADCWIEVPAGTCQVSQGDLLMAHQL